MITRLTYKHAEALYDFRLKASKESDYVNEISMKDSVNIIRNYSAKNKFAFGFINKNELLSHIFFTIEKETCFINLIAVLKEYQGKGLAYDLFKYAISFAKVSNCKRLELIVDSKNITAKSFYDKIGFKYKKKVDSVREMFELWI